MVAIIFSPAVHTVGEDNIGGPNIGNFSIAPYYFIALNRLCFICASTIAKAKVVALSPICMKTIKKKKKKFYTKSKSNNFTRRNREKSNNAIALKKE